MGKEQPAGARQQERLKGKEEIDCTRKTKAKLAAIVADLIMSPADTFADRAGGAGNIANVFEPNSPRKRAKTKQKELLNINR